MLTGMRCSSLVLPSSLILHVFSTAVIISAFFEYFQYFITLRHVWFCSKPLELAQTSIQLVTFPFIQHDLTHFLNMLSVCLLTRQRILFCPSWNQFPCILFPHFLKLCSISKCQLNTSWNSSFESDGETFKQNSSFLMFTRYFKNYVHVIESRH